MMLRYICSFFILLNISVLNAKFRIYDYDTLYYKQKLDHFSFTNQDKFLQRYLVNDKYWDRNGGPIFFYTGNEGDITLFAQNTGFMWEIAPEFKAMVIFAEHRYYGKSLPFGKNSFLNSSFTGYLTSEQALADFTDLLYSIKLSVKGAAKSPVIAFGGSYGGMLAAWFRMKYPHIVNGAIAASAPILQFEGMTSCDKFGQVVTKDFADESKDCADVIRKSWGELNIMAKTEKGRKRLNSAWKLCKPLKSESDLVALKYYLTDVWTNLAMVDYPYPATFLASLPAYPIKMVCQSMTNSSVKGEALLNQLFSGLSVYFNSSQSEECLDYSQDATSSLGELGWDFQACTEMVMPFCYDGKKDFFEPSPWNLSAYSQQCYKRWGVMPQPFMVRNNYGGRNFGAASNIVFSNGLLDPWSTGGVMESLSGSLVAIVIPEGAHHLDLRQSDPNDPKSVVEARQQEKIFIKKWIDESRLAEASGNEASGNVKTKNEGKMGYTEDISKAQKVNKIDAHVVKNSISSVAENGIEKSSPDVVVAMLKKN